MLFNIFRENVYRHIRFSSYQMCRFVPVNECFVDKPVPARGRIVTREIPVAGMIGYSFVKLIKAQVQYIYRGIEGRVGSLNQQVCY